MPSRHRLLLALACAVALTLVPVPSARASFETDVADLVNASRSDSGLPPLVQNADMDAVALAWAQRLVDTGAFEHNPDYADQIPAGWNGAAENLAGSSSPTPDGMHAMLMDSDGHRANILGDFTHVGIGVVDGGGGAMSVMVEVFGHYPAALPGDHPGGSGGSGSGGSGSGGSGAGAAARPATDVPDGWLGVGSSGAEVSALQQDLADLGYDVAVDGEFGEQTAEQVESFQSDAGLEPDGLAGPETLAAVASALAAVEADSATTATPSSPPSVSSSPSTTTPTTPPPSDPATTPATTPGSGGDSSTTPDIVPTDAVSGRGTLADRVPTAALVGTLGGATVALAGLLLLRRRLARRPGHRPAAHRAPSQSG